MSGEDRPSYQRGLKEPWKPGQSGNPAGRPVGARSKLQESYLVDLLEIWQAKGKAGLERVMKNDPATIVRVVAQLLPKEVKFESAALSEMSDDELSRIIDIIRATIPSLASAGNGTETPSEPDETPPLPTIQ